MAVAVTLNSEYGETEYHEATKWHVDERDMLHIVGNGGNVATYAHGVWRSAALVDGEVKP